SWPYRNSPKASWSGWRSRPSFCSACRGIGLSGPRGFPIPTESGKPLASLVCRIFCGEPLHTSPENALARRTSQHIHQLGDLTALLRLIAARDRMLDAMRGVIAHHLILDGA